MSSEKHTNALIHETSPYLLQHAHNPVNWQPWGDAAFEKAQRENKLVVISIGYSACHWCHVMERESFEDSAVAAMMNDRFVSVKVDREERPDVDQVYMTAVQLMSGSGGWPLNVVTLPDGRPIWGGTYFPKERWLKALQSVYEVHQNEPDKVQEYAQRLHEGIKQSELVELNTAEPDFTVEKVQLIYQNWVPKFDTVEGGPNRTPKFPTPTNYQFLLRYGHLAKNEEALEQVKLTLEKMAYGGIYDQLGGGFARYSTDAFWKVPHFEKMLYDNAQLVSLYSEAYQRFKDPLYREIVEESLEWVAWEMTGPDGEFYSALDADSEGEEGKFYIWTKAEIQQIAGEDFELISDFYNVNSKGLWENGHYILLRDEASDQLAEKHELSEEELQQKITRFKEKAFAKRARRIRPGLDDKSLTSWNAMMLNAYLDAYKVFGEENYLKTALKNANWLLENQLQQDGSLWHSYKKGESKIEGLIEDYAFSIQAFLKLFEVTFEERYLQQAARWMEYAKTHFEDSINSLFYYRSLQQEQLIAQSQEVYDNVIPATNSIMAHNLFVLSHYLDREDYREQAHTMLNQVTDKLYQYGEGFSNWGQLLLHFTYPFYEIAISGDEAPERYTEFQQNYLPNTVWISSTKESELALLENRHVKGKTLIYVCQDKVCQLPVEEVGKAVVGIYQ